MSRRDEDAQERCPERLGGYQCGLPQGHGKTHTLLIPTGVPWDKDPKQEGGTKDGDDQAG